MDQIEFAVIGGSGLYGMEDLSDIEEVTVSTPFGNPSDKITTGSLHGTSVAFLPRHGRQHQWSPSEIPYRANIYALKLMGVKYILSVSACGSLQMEYRPGEVVVPDQLIDFTKGKRENSFFGNGLVAHVGVAEPFSPEMSKVLAESIRVESGSVHEKASLITIEGPRFSTRAESHLYRQWGIGIIGMTTSPEAFLAAEAEIAYACMAHVTDYDVWHEAEEPVSVDQVLEKAPENTRLAQSVITNMIRTKNSWEGDLQAHSAMRDALGLISDWSGVPNSVKEDLYPLIGKYL